MASAVPLCTPPPCRRSCVHLAGSHLNELALRYFSLSLSPSLSLDLIALIIMREDGNSLHIAHILTDPRPATRDPRPDSRLIGPDLTSDSSQIKPQLTTTIVS